MKKKIFAVVMAVAMMALMALPAFAEEVTPVTTSDFTGVFDAITAQFSVSTIISVLATLAGICIGFVFMWWGVRKISGAIMRAVQGRGFRLG